MSTKVLVRVLADVPLSQLSRAQRQTDDRLPGKTDLIVAEVELHQFVPNVLDAQLQSLLERGLAVLAEKGCNDPKGCKLEVSVQLSSQGEGVRPAIHLYSQVVEQLAALGASLDFDPYCID